MIRIFCFVCALSSCALAQKAGERVWEGEKAIRKDNAEDAARRVAKSTAIDVSMSVVKNLNEPILENMKSLSLQMEMMFNLSAKQTEQFDILKNSFAEVTKSMNSYILANNRKHKKHKKEIAKLKERVAEFENK